MPKSTKECRIKCEIYKDWCKLEADNAGLVIKIARLEAEAKNEDNDSKEIKHG